MDMDMGRDKGVVMEWKRNAMGWDKIQIHQKIHTDIAFLSVSSGRGS